MGRATKVKYILLHLANFHDTIGTPIRTKRTRSKSWAGRNTLWTEEWNVQMDKVPDYAERYELFKAGAAYGITHTLSIRRKDGRLIDLDDIGILSSNLAEFLSFARGLRSQPFLALGFDDENELQWQTWIAPNVDSWRPVHTWFNFHDPVSLNDAWTAFNQAKQDPMWGSVLERAIPWYISANRTDGGPEGSLILAQTVLELLAWSRFVSERGLSPEGFEKVPASDKLRLLANEAKIQKNVPATLSNLLKLSRERNWDGPQAITEIRNALVHPSPKNRQKLEHFDTKIIFETYLLSLWYLDLLLLFFIGYSGPYHNRCVQNKWAGETERVPWNA